MLTVADLETAADALVHCLEGWAERAKELPALLHRLSKNQGYPVTSLGRMPVNSMTPSGKHLIVHERWQEGRPHPAVTLRFQGREKFSLLLPEMQTPTSRKNGGPVGRKLRRLLASPEWDRRNPGSLWHNLVAGKKERSTLFLQLAVYASREKWLDPEAEGEAFRRFEERFRRLVRLRPDQLAEGRK